MRTMAGITLEGILQDVWRALDNPVLQEGLRRAYVGAERRVPEILDEYPEIVELARRVEDVKRLVSGNLDHYIEQAMESLKKVNAEPHLAETAEDAREIIGRIVGKGKVVVMSKSMVAAEIGLRPHLEKLGNEVWETDLGELLIQLEGSKPMHTIAPAIHLTREEAAKLVSEKLGVELSGRSIEEIVVAVRRYLRGRFMQADVGISGANALAADTGALVLVENEGNIRLVTGLPPIHIAVVGVDKIVPTLRDAINVALVQAAYASLYPPTYLNVIAGPSSTADIEKKRVYGAHGPPKLHVVLVDNGRRWASNNPALAEQLRCIRCGRCQMECPVWRLTANHWGGPVYGGPMGVNWTAITLGEETGAELAHLCLGCARCDEVCPVGIPISRVIRYLKKRYAEIHRL